MFEDNDEYDNDKLKYFNIFLNEYIKDIRSCSMSKYEKKSIIEMLRCDRLM